MLAVKPVEHADVSQCIAMRIAALGSLVIGRPPPYPGYVDEAEAAVHANLDDPDTFVRHLKVVDPADESEVMAYAKWELYLTGRSKESLENLKKPMSEEDKTVDQYGALREAAHEYFCTRNGEMGKRPHLLLALLVTAEKHRRQGAGSLLVQWGLEKQKETDLNCYLQASAQGRSLYSHYGFQDIDTVVFDLEKYGLKGVEQMTEMIRYPTKSGRRD
ncbi:acyl-CoA N-acyltransferase [Staphylotrichum tortipilum]|uniref:Acyl-CoA N-acyltransferase n=1 Tax=Staphylotrichum tortipilum TaxID=2831512 RepID=A0AAN6RNA4_9PEZI|nr:acyl-CoA N-acyltransferase [Staphylotrichum longicolle]